MLSARNEVELHVAYEAARELDLPCHLWRDDDLPEHGAIALGLGPLIVTDDSRRITRRFNLM